MSEEVKNFYEQCQQDFINRTHNVIVSLAEENTQLKEEYQTALDENCKLSELWKDSQVENRQLKGILKEIREYITGNYDFYYGDELYDQYKDILEIIDKGIK